VAPTDATLELRPPGPSAAAPSMLLRAGNLHRVLGSGDAAALVLKGVNLLVRGGEYVAIVGPSGSGKSTLLYLLGGLDRPTRTDADGKPFDPPSAVFIAGQDTAALSDRELALLRNRTVGFVFQFHYLLKEFSAQENVALPMLKMGQLPHEAAMDRAAAILQRLGMGDKLRRKAHRLSGGEQQRVAIARALANQPQVLLADEPTGNLDRRNGEMIADVFGELHAQGQSIVMVTHEPTMAARAARRITMEDGRISADDRTP